MKKLDRHFGYYQCSLCGKKKGALYGETGAIGSNCSNVLRHTAGESHLRAWLADLPVEAEKPTLAELQTCVLLAVCPSIPTRGTLTLLSRRSQVDRAQVAGQRPLTAHHADQGAGAAQGAEGGDQRGGRRRRGRWPGGGGGADADDAGGYAAAPLLRRDHAGSGGRLGSADGGAGAGGGGGTDGGGHPHPDAVGI